MRFTPQFNCHVFCKFLDGYFTLLVLAIVPFIIIQCLAVFDTLDSVTGDGIGVAKFPPQPLIFSGQIFTESLALLADKFFGTLDPRHCGDHAL